MAVPSEDDITIMMNKCGIDPKNIEHRQSIRENMYGARARIEQSPDEKDYTTQPLMLKRMMQKTDELEIQGRSAPLPKQLSPGMAVKSIAERRNWSSDGKVLQETTGCLKVYSKKELKALKRKATLPVVDPAGDTLQLKIFSYPLVPITLGSPTLDDYDAIFRAGTVLAIKEPRIPLYSDYKDEACIRVDCPHDVVILDRKSLDALTENENLEEGFAVISPPEKDLIACKEEGEGGEGRQARLTGLMEENFECESRRCDEDRKDDTKKRELRKAILKEIISKSANKGHQNTRDRETYIAELRAGQKHAEMLLPVLEQSYRGSDNIMTAELAMLYYLIGICS